MRVVIARTMFEFSMNVYADGLITGLKTVRPNWEIVDLAPRSVDRTSRSWFLRAWKSYERFWRFPGMVEQQAADIFHIIEPAEAHIVYWLKKTGKPVVVTCHDLINFFERDNLRGSVQLPIVSRGLWLHAVKGMQYANHVVAVSSATAKDTAQILNIEPAYISVTPNGVEAIFQPLPNSQIESFRQEHGVLSERFCLLNVGANHPRKNIFTILKLVEILKQRGLPIHFWKVGADFTDEQKTFIQKQELNNYVSYLGKPDKSTLLQIYNAADTLIAPSLHEGFGITILEAMACGTPVITSSVSAMPEVAGDAAILVEPTDVQALVESVVHLQNDPTYRQRLIERGLARAKSFTWENTAEQVAQVYEKVLVQNRRRDRIFS